jgi:hypothetical protein
MIPGEIIVADDPAGLPANLVLATKVVQAQMSMRAVGWKDEEGGPSAGRGNRWWDVPSLTVGLLGGR